MFIQKRIVTAIILCIMCILFGNVIVFAGSWNNTKSYQEYLFQKSIANEAESEGNYLFAAENYLLTSEKALKCTNINVYGWQINNAIYAVIKHQQQCGKSNECYQYLKDILPLYKKLENVKLTDLQLMQCLENNYKYIVKRVGE